MPSSGIGETDAATGVVRRRSVVQPFLLWAVVAFVALGALAYTAVERLNAVERDGQVRLANTALTFERERLAILATEYSWWDVATKNVLPTVNPEWVAENIGEHAHDNLDVDLTVVVDRADRIHLSIVNGETAAAPGDPIRDPDIRALIDQARRSPMDPVSGSSGYALIGGVLHAVGVSAFSPELPPEDAKPDLNRAVLLYAREIDEAFLETQAERFGLDDLSIAAVNAKNPVMSVTSPTNRALVALAWTIRQPGTELVTTLVLPVILLFAVLGLIAWRFLVRAQTMSRALADASQVTDRQNQQLREREAEAVRSRMVAEHAVEEKDGALAVLRQRNAELDIARREAMESSHAKTMFLAAMSHELRTPLNSIIGFSEILQDQRFGPLGTPRYVEYAGNIRSSGTHLLELINDVLDIAKIEAGKMVIEREPVRVDELCGRTCDLFREQALTGNVALQFDRSGTPLVVNADPRAIRQVLINLLSNAIKFTRPGDEIRVSTRYPEAQDGVAIVVSDTGPGIPETHLETVFRPFERVNEAADQQGGTGLGLSLVKSLTELHGGTVSLESAVGAGTTITVWLPAEGDAAGAPA